MYNIRNISILRIVVSNVYITKQIANIAKYISRRRMTIKPKQITIVPIMTP